MPAKINLDAQHDDIRKWVSECVPQEDIRARLLMEHNVRISSATMKLTLKRLGIRYNSRAPRIKTTPELKTRVAYMFNELRLSDEETVDMLRAEGFEVNLLRLRRLRREVGLFKRTVKSQAEDTDAMMRRVLQQELDDGVIQEMGRMHLYNYMRAKYNIHGRSVAFR